MHRGQEYEHDLDVERLQQVTRRIIIEFATHLTPEHGPIVGRASRSSRRWPVAPRSRAIGGRSGSWRAE
jgi:hypothetical protein